MILWISHKYPTISPSSWDRHITSSEKNQEAASPASKTRIFPRLGAAAVGRPSGGSKNHRPLMTKGATLWWTNIAIENGHL